MNRLLFGRPGSLNRSVSSIQRLNGRIRLRTVLLLSLSLLSLFSFRAPVHAQDTGSPIVAYITEPDPKRSFVVTDKFVYVRGTVIFDPQYMQYWQVDIRSTSPRGFIGSDAFNRIPAYDWVTLDSTRTDSVVEGELAHIPPWPALSPGNWLMRLVVKGPDNQFAMNAIIIPFTVTVPNYPQVPIQISHPAAGSTISDNNSISGSIKMNQYSSGYRIELLGGQYTQWTIIDTFTGNEVAHPTIIENGVLGHLPPLDQLEPGQYRLRIEVLGMDANRLADQPPYEVTFSVFSDKTSNLASVALTSPKPADGRITIKADTDLVGSVFVPAGAGYYKVDIKDNIRDPKKQLPRFIEWTTVGDVHTQSVSDGIIEHLAGPPVLAPGEYWLRIVVVNSDGSFSDDPYVLNLTVRAP